MITKEQAVDNKYSYFIHVSKTLSDKVTPLRVRRNGATKTWKSKKNINKFSIPVKFGLYEHGYITEENAHEWKIP